MRLVFQNLLFVSWLAIALPAWAELYTEFEPPEGARIGIFIGAFDPPHESHHALLEAALEQGNLDYVIIIPNGAAIHKPSALDVKVRQTMLRSIYENDPRVVVNDSVDKLWDMRMRLNIIKDLRSRVKGVKVVGIYGMDLLQENLKNKVSRIAMKSSYDEMIVAANRPGFDPAELSFPERVWGLPTTYVRYEDPGNSSTRIRNFLKSQPGFYDNPLSNSEAERIAAELRMRPEVVRGIHALKLYAAVEPRSCQWFWARVGKIFEGQ